MRIGIIGSGDVGQALGTGLARHGHDVMISSRTPAKLEGWRTASPGKRSTGTFAEAAAHGEVVILATNGVPTVDILTQAGAEKFAGKLVLDATNPLEFSEDGPPSMFVGTTDSLGERIQRALPTAKVVKCFNTVPNARMIDPQFQEDTPPMLICGEDEAAKKRTENFLVELGWPGVVDVGGIDGARYLESLVGLWARIGMATGTWDHAFKVVR